MYYENSPFQQFSSNYQSTPILTTTHNTYPKTRQRIDKGKDNDFCCYRQILYSHIRVFLSN